MGSGAVFALSWLALVLALGALALPVAALPFRDLEDRGAAFAIPLALAVVALLVYWLGRLAFPPAPLAAVLVLAGVASLVRRQGVAVSWRAYAEAAAVFAVAFGLSTLVRAINPSIVAGGEMFWNFGLLQSLLRTTQLPPQDPWFAGEPVRYYYGGHLLAAILAELTDTPGRIAYNLALGVFYAATVTAAYGVAGAVAAANGWPRRSAAVLGGFFAGFASNFYTPVRVTLLFLPDDLGVALAEAVAISPARVTDFASLSTVDATHFTFTNTDFPLYGVFIGGLHPHVMSPPVLLVVVGLLLAYFTAPADARRRRVALLAATTPPVGLIALTNTWSLPTACGLVAVAVALAPAHPRSLLWFFDDRSSLAGWPTRIAGGAVVGVLVGLVGVLWVFPYFVRGLAGDPGLGLLPPRSGARFFVYGYGGFLLAFGAYLLVELREGVESSRIRALAILLAIAFAAAGPLLDFYGLALLGPLLLAGWYLRATGRAGYEAVLLVAGAGLALLVELAYVRESAEFGRFNTVYKVYSQVWIVWAPAAGVALARVYHGGSRGLVDNWRPAFAAFLVVSLSLYGAGGVGVHLLTLSTPATYDPAAPTLDGLAYLEHERPDYAAALEWLAAHEGQPTIVSGPVTEDRLYQFNASPAASLTGVPTLVGWNHEADYRGRAVYEERVAVVDSIYAGTRAERARMLRRYGVDYVWVGEGEHERYVTIDYSREPGIRVAFQRGNVTVYAVDASELATE